MIVGLNLLYLLPGVVGGTETYAQGLLEGLATIDSDLEFVVFVNREAARWPLPASPRFHRVVCPVDAVHRGERYWFEQRQLPRYLRAQGVAVVHSLGYVAPVWSHCPRVVTVHDLNFRAFGHQMPLGRRLALRAMVSASIRRAQAVITDSAFARTEILSAYPISAHRVTSIPLAPHPALVAPPPDRAAVLRAHLGVSGRYVVGLSSSSPNKNLPFLVRAINEGRRAGLPYTLVIVGHLPPGELASVHEGGILTTGFVSPEELAAVLVGAEGLVFPSLHEGFGLPVLEAMTLGVPVFCSDRTSLPEVGGEAAVYFNPEDISDLLGRLLTHATDETGRMVLRQRGLAQAARFSWARTAAETVRIYRQVVSDASASALELTPGRQLSA